MLLDDELNNLESPDYNQLLKDLADDEKEIHYSTYALFSDLPVEVFEKFTTIWPKVNLAKRESLSRNMADLTEDNYQVDFSPLAPIFFGDKSEGVRLAGLDMLWDSDNTTLIKPIIRLMETDESNKVRASAASTLGHFLLQAQWGEVGEFIEEPIVSALLTQLDNPLLDPLVRKASIEAVSSSGHERVPGLIKEAYEKGDDAAQISAVFSMGRTADPRWMYILKEELSSLDAEMRAEASRAIGNIGDSSETERIVDLARFDDDLGVRIGAIYALGQIGNDIATDALNELGENEEEDDEVLDAVEDALDGLMMVGLDIDMALMDMDEYDDDDDLDGYDLD